MTDSEDNLRGIWGFYASHAYSRQSKTETYFGMCGFSSLRSSHAFAMRLPRGKNYQESVFGVNAPNQSFPSQCW
jgi:hypothetical protein